MIYALVCLTLTVLALMLHIRKLNRWNAELEKQRDIAEKTVATLAKKYAELSKKYNVCRKAIMSYEKMRREANHAKEQRNIQALSD